LPEKNSTNENYPEQNKDEKDNYFMDFLEMDFIGFIEERFQCSGMCT